MTLSGSLAQVVAPSCTAETPPSEMPTCPGVVCQTPMKPPVSKPNQRDGRPSGACTYWQLAGTLVRFALVPPKGSPAVAEEDESEASGAAATASRCQTRTP